MTPDRFQAITARYPTLEIAIVGDFCLDRYLEIEQLRFGHRLLVVEGRPIRSAKNK